MPLLNQGIQSAALVVEKSSFSWTKGNRVKTKSSSALKVTQSGSRAQVQQGGTAGSGGDCSKNPLNICPLSRGHCYSAPVN